MQHCRTEHQLADTQELASETVQEKTGETVQEQTDETPQVVRRISGKQRRASLEEYKEAFLPVPSIEDRKPVFLSRSTRDALDRIVRMFGERRMSVSGLVENIARQHLATYGEIPKPPAPTHELRGSYIPLVYYVCTL